jgi:hypothetical protein
MFKRRVSRVSQPYRTSKIPKGELDSGSRDLLTAVALIYHIFEEYVFPVRMTAFPTDQRL